MNQRNSTNVVPIDTRAPRIPRVQRRQSDPVPFEPFGDPLEVALAPAPAPAEASSELGFEYDAPRARDRRRIAAYLVVAVLAALSFGGGLLLIPALHAALSR